MTYSPETMIESDVSTAPSDSEASTIDKLKTLTAEGTQRAQRITQILKAAFSETRSEFQAGRSVITPLAKDVTTEAVSTFKSTKQQATEAVNQAWQEGDSKADLSDRLVNFIKVMAKAAKEKLFPQVKQQAIKLDDVLENRYGDQYGSFKGRFDVIRQWVVVSEPTQTTNNSESEVVIEVDSEVVQ